MQLEDVTQIAVLGAGNMGHGIAEVAALAGYAVTMRDVEREYVEDGYKSIEWSLKRLEERGDLDEDTVERTLDRIEPVVDLEAAVEEADVIVEAVPEQRSIKADVYASALEYASEDAIFVSNTSSLSITDLASVTDRPDHFCGMHFFNPPVRMPLVEVIAGADTAPATLDLVVALAEDLGKEPVRVRKDSPGFIVNRVLVPFVNEAVWLLDSAAASVETVDATVTAELDLPMGAFELADQIGIDVILHVLRHLQETLGAAYRPAPALLERADAGTLGKKTGTGFYDYDTDGAAYASATPDDAVRQRLLAIAANETAGLIGDDVADASAIDRAMRLGAGFTTGPAALADAEGLETIVAVLDALSAETGAVRYEATDTLREAATAGGFTAGETTSVSPSNEDVATDASDGASTPLDADYDALTVELHDCVAHVELDRPERLNTISVTLLKELETAVEGLDQIDEVRAILLTGAGDRAFSAGANVTEAFAGATATEGVKLARHGQRVMETLERADVPVVAGIDGYCLGGGMELAAAADLRIASVGSTFGQPEHDLGLLPGWGGTQRLARLVGEGRAKEVIFTTDRYDAEAIAEYGFLTDIVPSEELVGRALALASDLADGPPIAQAYTKRAIHAGRGDGAAGFALEAQAFGGLFETDDFEEGLDAFETDREPTFEGR
jgi:enoyl-CoA hydratase/3-hydroxyacyl-CoA dehydrogenase